MKRKLRVLVVDDSLLFVETLSRLLAAEGDMEIVGTALNGADALFKAKNLRPDIITLDIEMPIMNGITFLRNLFPVYTCPVVVVTALPVDAFEAMSAGAVDFVKKPVITKASELDEFGKKLRGIVRISSNAKVIRTADKVYNVSPKDDRAVKYNIGSIIAIGASTGGTEALPKVLERLPQDCPPVAVVLHMPEGFTAMYAQRLNRMLEREVVEARHGMYLKRSQVVIAQGGRHMRILRDANGYFVSVSRGEKVSGHCPSVDVLFESVAQTAGRNAVGVILTGMGADGASGLMRIRKAGGRTIGQDEETSVVYGMPKAAYEAGAVEVQRPLSEIGTEIVRRLTNS